MNTTAVIYARVSTDEQAKGFSLNTQVAACQKYAAERGYQVIGIFREDFTGASMDRPELNKLRELVTEQQVKVMLVYDIDRIARKAMYQMLIEEELAKLDAKVEYVIGQYAETDEGTLHKQIRASIAEYEKAKIIERLRRDKRGMATSGYVIVGARPPYGYKVVSEPHKSWLEIDEAEAAVIRQVYYWYINGDEQGNLLSIGGISRKLTEMGILTRGDKVKHVAKKRALGIWSDKMVRNILTNTTYIGTWYFGKTKMVGGNGLGPAPKDPKRGFGKQVARDPEEWIAVQVPPIISVEIFEAARERLELNFKQSKRNTKQEYLFGRRLKCAHCGYSIVGMQRRIRNRYYRCNGAWRKPKLCDMPNFRVDQVDRVIWVWLSQLLENPQNALAGIQAMEQEKTTTNQALFDHLTIIEGKIQETEMQKGKLLDLYLLGDLSPDLMHDRLKRFDESIASLKQEHAEVSTRIQPLTITNEQFSAVEEFCQLIHRKLENASFDQKRQVIDLLDVRGTLSIENGEKVVYVTCQLEPQPVSVAPISHLSNTGATGTTPCACLSTAPSP